MLGKMRLIGEEVRLYLIQFHKRKLWRMKEINNWVSY